MKELIEIQAELKAPKNQFNSFGKYKYRSCEDILEAVKPLLKSKDCVLTLSDEIKEAGGIVYVEATATITRKTNVKIDGETVIEKVEVKAQAGIDPNRKGMDIAQSFGSSSSYARKYALNGLFLIDDTKDADSTNDHGKGVKAPAVTPAVKQVLTANHPKYNDCIKYLKGAGSMTKLKEGYEISKDVEEKLMAIVLA